MADRGAVAPKRSQRWERRLSNARSVPEGRHASSSQSETTGVATFLRALRKHWGIVVALALLAAGASILISKSLPRIYDATALIELNVSVIRPLGDKTDDLMPSSIGWLDNQEYYETQYKIVTSQRVLTVVARDLNLMNDLEFLRLNKEPRNPLTADEAALVLHDRIRVEPVRNSRLFVLHVEDVDPQRARRICSAVANTYVEQNLQIAINGTSDAVVWLNDQLDHVKSDLEHNENALYDFKERNDLPSTSINEASNMLRVEMQELDMALTHTRTKRQELAARAAELLKISPDAPDQLPGSELLASVFLQSLRTQYQDAVKEHGALLAEGKGENHPLVKRAAEKVDETKKGLFDEVQNIEGSVQRDLAIVTREEAGEAGLFEATRKRAVDLNMKEIEYHRLDRAREQNEKLFAMLLERTKQADMARMLKGNNIRLVDEPLEPKTPIRPRTTANVLLGLLAGLVLGALFAWLREQLDNSLKTPDELEQRLGVTFLGLLPELEEDENAARKGRRRRGLSTSASSGPLELVVHEHPLSGIAEAARSVRTNIMFMNPDRPHRTLLVTSAAPSEGKTTVACSIAIALAQGGQRVCIVDCDLRRPRLHRIFGRSGDAGVTNVLVGDATLDEVAKPTVVDNLWSIPAGPTPPNPADMLHSARFRKFVEQLREKFDRVVVDSPPIVAVTDSAIISTLVDGSIFVVRAFRTSRHVSAQGLRSLRDVDAPVVGAVLNAVNLNRSEYSYYQHYYYYKKEGYRSATPDDGAEAEGAANAPPN